MTSLDVRDVLELPGQAGPRPAKKQKINGPRSNLKGLAREVQSLGGDNPIAIVPEVSVFKKRRLASRKPASKWESKPFTNSARDDGLVLRHWKKKAEEPAPVPVPTEGEMEEDTETRVPPVEDSNFAKYNVHIKVPQFTDEQYTDLLESEDWTRQETEYLLELVQEYDLRWPVIWDRYEYQPLLPSVEVPDAAMAIIPKERTLEMLKKRYYHIAAEILKANQPLEMMNHVEFDMYEKMRAFDPAQETRRKKFAETAMNRTAEDAKEEESLLLELKRILARADKMGTDRKELYNTLEAPSSQSNMAVYTSSQGLQQLLQQLMQSDKNKKRMLMGRHDAASPATAGGAQQQPNFPGSNRADSVHGSVSGPSGANPNNKKGAASGQNEQRQLTEAEETMYGVAHTTDRSVSGPIFRHEKLNKLITSKSSMQQAKITNCLGELNIPSRLIMPTSDVGAVWTQFLDGMFKLLDIRKAAEKAKNDLQVMTTLKTERDKKERAARGEPEPEIEGEVKVEGEDREKSVVRAGSISRSTRGGSVGAHKRSASVLSSVSDVSTKRQKK